MTVRCKRPRNDAGVFSYPTMLAFRCPGAEEARMNLANPWRGRTYLGSVALFGLIAAMFLVELAMGAVDNDARLLGLGALPDSGGLHGEYWRLLAFGFLHSNATHLLLNSLLLLLAGPAVERRAGA